MSQYFEQPFSAMEALRWAFSRYGEDAGYCFGFLGAIELGCVVAAASIAFHGALAAQLILQLDGVPPDSYVYLFIAAYAIVRMLAQPIVSRWLLALHDGRKTTFDELLGFDFLYHLPATMKTAGASIVFFFYALFGSLLFLLPGLYATSTLRFYKFLTVERDSEAVQALRESYEICGENKGQLIVLNLMCCLVKLGGLVLFGVGYIPASAACGLAEAYAYKTLLEQYSAPHQAVNQP